MLNPVKRLAACCRGATAIEYSLIIGLVVIALIGGLSFLGGTNGGHWAASVERVSAVEP